MLEKILTTQPEIETAVQKSKTTVSKELNQFEGIYVSNAEFIVNGTGFVNIAQTFVERFKHQAALQELWTSLKMPTYKVGLKILQRAYVR